MEKNRKQEETEVNTPEDVKATSAETAAEQEPKAPETPEAAPAEPTSEEKLAADLADCQDKYRRMLAEYDNFRKRSAREKESVYSDAVADTIAAFLPVLDNLDRALLVETADEAFKKGVDMTQKQFYDCLAKLKCTEIAAKGEQFDPAFHNAVMHVDDETVDDNTVVEVFQKGFTVKERVIRHAMVKVAN